jgi:glycosyltransferase involved in cell wall biosynthesis
LENVLIPTHPTFVVLGTIEGRKNHLLLLQVWRRLVDRFGDAAPRLIIIGQRGWAAEPVFELLDRSSKLRGHVVELSGIADEEVAFHLTGARALLFPSLAEGYGLPLVEALGLGTPVIASDLPVFYEIGQDVPLLLDPLDTAAWEAAIMDFQSPESILRSRQIERARHFRPPTWHDHFKIVESWLSGLSHRSPAAPA